MRLYHGGASGFTVGALIEPHETKRVDDCPICEAGADANHLPDRVFLTPVRLYAKYYASKWVGGTLYVVSPEGEAVRSEGDSIETYHAPAVRVVRVTERSVLLTPGERRHLARVWSEADEATGKAQGPEYSAADHMMRVRLGMR